MDFVSLINAFFITEGHNIYYLIDEVQILTEAINRYPLYNVAGIRGNFFL